MYAFYHFRKIEDDATESATAAPAQTSANPAGVQDPAQTSLQVSTGSLADFVVVSAEESPMITPFETPDETPSSSPLLPPSKLEEIYDPAALLLDDLALYRR